MTCGQVCENHIQKITTFHIEADENGKLEIYGKIETIYIYI